MDLWAFLGMSMVSDQVSAFNRSIKLGQEAASTEAFLNANSWCYIYKKEERPTRHKRYLLDFSTEYWLYCIGLDTGETKEILVDKDLFIEAISMRRLIQFNKHKDSDWALFKQRNKKSGIILLKKYADEKSKFNMTYLFRVYGNDSDSVCVISCDKESYNSINEGDFVIQPAEAQNSTVDNASTYALEDTWYNAVQYDTFDIEELIETADENGYLYAYFDNGNFELDNFRISNKAPVGADFVFVDSLSNQDVILLYDTQKMSDEEFKKWEEQTPQETKDRLYKLINYGCPRVKIKALKKYPIQTRQNFCTLINALWLLGIWYENGQTNESLDAKGKANFNNRKKLLQRLALSEDFNILLNNFFSDIFK